MRRHFRSFQDSANIFNIVSPLSLPFFLFPLPFSLLSFPLFLCLVYLLSQPRKSRDYQRDNPSGRGLLLPASTESCLFFPLLLPSVLSYFLSEAGGEGLMMGVIPLLAPHTSFSPPFFLWLKFILSTSTTILLTLLALLRLFIFFPPIKPDLQAPIHTHVLYTPLQSPEPPVSPLNKSIWVNGGWGVTPTLVHKQTPLFDLAALLLSQSSQLSWLPRKKRK